MITSSEQSELLALRAENARLKGNAEQYKADADRYRKLKAHMTFEDINLYLQNSGIRAPTFRRWYHDSHDLSATTLDAAIDAMKDGK